MSLEPIGLAPSWVRNSLVGACLVLTLGSAAAAAQPAAVPAIDFNRDVRPILAENCFACHGSDANKRMAGLRLDKVDALRPLPSGRTAIVAGKPDASALFHRITAPNALVMPPQSTGKKLTRQQIETLRRWIEQGGQYAGHWAYIRPRRVPLPAVQNVGWPLNPIDRFILARLERERLQPSPGANRPTLIRRLSLDLLGLPPRPEEVQAFVADRRPGAYERLVDRLLASPHYGERMAQYWLDLVRYADTVGYHGDQDVTVWPYRDYVIDAFNENKRFDVFTREQLAGDLLPNAGTEQRVASGYNRLGMMSAEGGVQDKEYRAKYASERVRNASVVWLGQTLGCAECHDHKFDPLTAKDFYQFAAFFADLKEQGFYADGFGSGNWGPSMRLPTDSQKAQLSRLDAEIETAKKDLSAITHDSLAESRARWEAAVKAADASKQPVWTQVTPTSALSSGGSTMTVEPEGVVFVSGKLPTWDTYTITIPAPLDRIVALRLEALGDERLPGNGVARAGYYPVLSEIEVAVHQGTAGTQPVKLRDLRVSGELEGFPALAAIDARPETGWAQMHGAPLAVLRLAEPVQGGAETRLVVRIRHETRPRLAIGKFRLSLTGFDWADLNAGGVPEDVLKALRKGADQRTPAEQETIAGHYRTLALELTEKRARLAHLEAERSLLLGEIPQTLITETVEPRVMRVLPRGNWMDDSGEIVQPGVPQLFPRIPKAGRATRLDLAQWIASPQNPLAARVFTNRLWKLYLGVGLAKNLDDFGVQGEAPVHPDLLDWLATEFLRSGWDVKHMVRLIVTSRTYRQSSKARPDLQQRDPYNRLYARQSPLRLDAEFVRDVALAAGGLLAEKVGGRSVRPYQPAGYLAALNFPRREWSADVGEELYRRGLYMHWQRTFLHPALVAFDAPTREECTANRTVSNTPMQALVLLNDPVFVEAARALAGRIIRQGGTGFDDRLRFAFQITVSRTPSSQEAGILRQLYQSRRARYSADRAAAERLVSVGEAPVPRDLDAIELAAWTSVARALLNMHETITRG
jgi:mono/diheme cytochrome c family protein